MKKPLILICSLFFLATSIEAQVDGLPMNPEPGKCYIRFVTPAQYHTVEKRVLVRPAYTMLTRVPAEYKTVEERVLAKQASKRYVAYQAEYKTAFDTIQVEEPYNEITIMPAKLRLKIDSIEVRPKLTRMEWQYAFEDCKSKDPRDCMVLKNVEHPAEFRRFDSQTVEREAAFARTKKGGRAAIVTRQVVAKEARFETIEVPAEYTTITKRVLVKDEEVVQTEVPAEYVVATVEVLEDAGGIEKWEEIDCNLTNNTVLPITYELGSARLTADAQNLIDSKLLKLMRDKPNIRVEISAHTDSRGAADTNQSLSQARAESVVNYLVGRGIKRSRLVAKGYGETQLKNRCTDGLRCTEAEHAQNRRTEFRVLSN